MPPRTPRPRPARHWAAACSASVSATCRNRSTATLPGPTISPRRRPGATGSCCSTTTPCPGRTGRPRCCAPLTRTRSSARPGPCCSIPRKRTACTGCSIWASCCRRDAASAICMNICLRSIPSSAGPAACRSSPEPPCSFPGSAIWRWGGWTRASSTALRMWSSARASAARGCTSEWFPKRASSIWPARVKAAGTGRRPTAPAASGSAATCCAWTNPPAGGMTAISRNSRPG